MSTEPTWGRALSRYGDRIYRLALLRDPDPERAVAATTAAFRAIDWSTATLDEQLETRLLAALPLVKRDLRWSLRRRRPPTLMPGVPAAFWALPAPTRLALALRLNRGYSSEAIATALAQPPDELRSRLLGAIGLLAGDHLVELADACRRCRLARLDDATADRRHVIECAACQGAIPRWEQSEEKLALALAQATGALRLPRASVEALADELSRGPLAARAGRRWRRPELLQAALVLAVVFAIMALILPQRNVSQGARPPTTARGLLEASLGRYGTPPEGEGVVHRRYRFGLDTPQGDYLAEIWTDAAQPARHRMQLSTGKQLIEWQAGDGERKLRYAARTNQFCGAQYDSEMLALGSVNTWESDAAQQAAQHAARWSFGPWALGRRYLEQALAADTVRSLGIVAGDRGAVVTLAADGRAISGTLLLTLDGATGDLREVREVADDNGQTRARTAWQLLEEQHIPTAEARKAAIFTGSPWKSEFRELKRQQPILDPACPLLRDENLQDLATSVATPWPPIYGLAQVPPGTSHMFVAGYPPPDPQSSFKSQPESLVYLGPGKRLVLQTGNSPSFKLPEEGVTGEWMVRMRSTSAGGWEGEAGSLVDAGGQDWRAFAFSAEGWARDELETALAGARVLSLADALAEELPLWSPNPVPPAVAELVLAAGLADSPADRAFHAVVEYHMRADPNGTPLYDPYHARSMSGTTDMLTAYGPTGERENFRGDFRPSDPAQGFVQWGNGDQHQIYLLGLGVLENIPDMFEDPLWRVEYALRNIFRYHIYERSESGEHITLSATLPLSETHYAEWKSIQAPDRPANPHVPWLADLEPETITFRFHFERRSGQLRAAETWANVGRQTTLIDRLTLKVFEEVKAGAGGDWEFEVPPGTPTLDVSFSAAMAPTARTITKRADLLAAAPVSLWGWNDDAVRFVEAEAPHRDLKPNYFFYQSLDEVVQTGAAAEITWDHPTLGHFTTLQGQSDYMRLVLMQTPAEWTESRVAGLLIGGMSHQAWVMRDRGDRHWVIMELDETLIVASYQGQGHEDELLAALQDLEPLRPEVVLNRNLPMPIRCGAIQEGQCIQLGGTAVPLAPVPSDD